VSDQDQIGSEEVVKPTPNPRAQIEEDIAARHEAARVAEEARIREVIAPDPNYPDPAPPEAPADAATATETPPETPPAPEMVTVKIEGQEFQVERAKVDEQGGLEAFQKKTAADVIFRRAKEREAQANQILAQARQFQPTQPQQPIQNQNEQLDQTAQLIEAIRFEQDPRRAAEAIQKLISPHQINQQQVEQAAIQRASHVWAAEKFKEKYPDIVNDPILYGIAGQAENHLLAQGRRDFDNIYKEVGEYLTQWKGKLAGNFQEKQKQKATITNIPQAKAKAVTPEQPRELTTAEIIAQERRARKQI